MNRLIFPHVVDRNTFIDISEHVLVAAGSTLLKIHAFRAVQCPERNDNAVIRGTFVRVLVKRIVCFSRLSERVLYGVHVIGRVMIGRQNTRTDENHCHWNVYS